MTTKPSKTYTAQHWGLYEVTGAMSPEMRIHAYVGDPSPSPIGLHMGCKVTERNRVLLEARTREAERATQEARAAQTEAQMQAQQASTAREEALAARTEAESARASAETMAQQLAELQAEQTKRGMVMTLSDVLFDTGGATLKPGADLALNRLADFLQQNPDTHIIVEGHTDSIGSDSYNANLCRCLGQAVLYALASRGVVACRRRVVVRGVGV
jgi:outer membrane protein OmpA-like peptidoglycan-associated protein